MRDARCRFLRPAHAEAVFQVEVTTRIGRGHHLGTRSKAMAHLAFLQAGRRVGLGDVVDAGTAATPLGLGTFMQHNPGERAQDGAWLSADLLTVAKMA